MRMLHFSPGGVAEALSQAIARSQKASCDKIPPAYPCEKEKLLFIGIECKGAKPHKNLVDLCKDMSTDRAKNIAFYVVGGGMAGIEELKKIVEGKGINVVAPIHQNSAKLNLFGKGKATDADIKAAVDWAQQVVDSLA